MSSIVATATGVSSAITLTPGNWVLQFTSAGAFTLDVQVGDADGLYDLYYDPTTKVTIDSSTGPRHIVVVGEMSYRMDISTYNNPITMRAVKVS